MSKIDYSKSPVAFVINKIYKNDAIGTVRGFTACCSEYVSGSQYGYDEECPCCKKPLSWSEAELKKYELSAQQSENAKSKEFSNKINKIINSSDSLESIINKIALVSKSMFEIESDFSDAKIMVEPKAPPQTVNTSELSVNIKTKYELLNINIREYSASVNYFKYRVETKKEVDSIGFCNFDDKILERSACQTVKLDEESTRIMSRHFSAYDTPEIMKQRATNNRIVELEMIMKKNIENMDDLNDFVSAHIEISNLKKQNKPEQVLINEALATLFKNSKDGADKIMVVSKDAITIKSCVKNYEKLEDGTIGDRCALVDTYNIAGSFKYAKDKPYEIEIQNSLYGGASFNKYRNNEFVPAITKKGIAFSIGENMEDGSTCVLVNSLYLVHMNSEIKPHSKSFAMMYFDTEDVEDLDIMFYEYEDGNIQMVASFDECGDAKIRYQSVDNQWVKGKAMDIPLTKTEKEYVSNEFLKYKDALLQQMQEEPEEER